MLASVAGCLPRTNCRAESVTQEMKRLTQHDSTVCLRRHRLHNVVGLVTDVVKYLTLK